MLIDETSKEFKDLVARGKEVQVQQLNKQMKEEIRYLENKSGKKLPAKEKKAIKRKYAFKINGLNNNSVVPVESKKSITRKQYQHIRYLVKKFGRDLTDEEIARVKVGRL